MLTPLGGIREDLDRNRRNRNAFDLGRCAIIVPVGVHHGAVIVITDVVIHLDHVDVRVFGVRVFGVRVFGVVHVGVVDAGGAVVRRGVGGRRRRRRPRRAA